MAAPSHIAGRYELERRLGAGGMSTVFLGQDTVLERPVAVKLLAEHLAEDDDFVARFRREALAAARLQHPNVVQVFDSGLDAESQRHYIVMEFVDGPSCADILRDEKRLDLDDAVHIIRDACHGLDYAHRAGVVHRDVKPGNLLLASESNAVKLADFGIAKAAEQTRITQVGSVLGTAAYLSPEQARGEEAGPASDIYSLGVCAYQFLAGRLPHEYSSLTELALKQQEETVEPITVHRPEVPPELDRAIRVCLAREPEARYPTTLEMAHALDAGLHGEVTDATRLLAASAAPLAADMDATRALGQTEATRPLRRRTTTQAPAAATAYRREPTGAYPPAARSEAGPTNDEKRARRRKRLSIFFALLAVAVAIAAVAVALNTSGTTSGPDPVSRGDVQQQVSGVKQFLRQNTAP